MILFAVFGGVQQRQCLLAGNLRQSFAFLFLRGKFRAVLLSKMLKIDRFRVKGFAQFC